MKVGIGNTVNMLAHLGCRGLQLNDFGQRFTLYTDQRERTEEAEHAKRKRNIPASFDPLINNVYIININLFVCNKRN